MGEKDRNPSETNTSIPLEPENNNLLYIATYNVRTLSSHARLLELMDALKNTKFDIIGLSETRRLGNSIQEYENVIFHYIGETPGLHGVGFLVKKHLKTNIESFTGLSERVALLTLNVRNFKISIIQVYAPTDAASDAEIESFYDTIDKALKISEKNLIVMGDFNAKIGQPKPEENLIMKSHGYGIRNNRGERLIEFAYENKLSIINTFYKKKNNQKWTWRSPDGTTKNEIDYILTNLQKNVQNLQVINLNFPTDHRLVRATFFIQKLKVNRMNYANNSRSSLKNENEISRYKQSLIEYSEDLTRCQDIHSVQECYDKIVNILENSLKKALIQNKDKERSSVISTHTTKLIQRRSVLQKIKPKTRAMKNELKALYKLVSKYVRKDYTNHRKHIIEKHLNCTGGIKKAYKELRSHKTWIEGLHDPQKTTHDRKEILHIATNFYENLYSAPERPEVDQIESENDDNDVEINPVDEAEIITEIKRLKEEKSPGPDRITNEAIKIAGAYLVNPLSHLFNLILNSAVTPKQWSESDIILLFKKGDPKNIGNYRPISLLPSLYKLFSSIIEKRISTTLEKSQPIEQAGFRKSYSTIDHIHSLELLVEKYQEYRRPLYIGFVDYQKAFDTILHNSIWKALQTQKVEKKYVQVLKYLYKNNTSRVKLETAGPPIPIKRGVRQGDPLSPRIFIAVLEMIIGKLNWDKSGICIEGKHISHLRFADDIVLLSENSTELESMLQALQQASREVGLEINLSKTKLMTNAAQNSVSLDNTPVEYVTSYVYLGKQISFQKLNDAEIDRRIIGTWKKFWSLKEILKSQLPMKIKSKVMDSCLLPSLTYACQTWKFTRKVKNKITSCQRSMERSVAKIRKCQKIRHTIIRQKTGVIDALTYALKLKWRWAGHVARMSDDRWTIRITSWPGPIGTRKRGRPVTRWSDDITRVAGNNWLIEAKDRDHWGSLEEAFTLTT